MKFSEIVRLLEASGFKIVKESQGERFDSVLRQTGLAQTDSGGLSWDQRGPNRHVP